MERTKLILGDCLKLLSDIPEKSIDLIITDPPYWHKKSPGKPYSERNQCKTNSKFSNSSLYNVNGGMMHEMSDFTDEDIDIFLTESSRVMKTMNAYIFCNETQVPYYSMWAEKHNYMFSILVWEKPLSIINKNRFSQNLEYIVRIYDYGTGLNRLNENEYYNRVKKDKPVSGQSKVHPTQKPISIVVPFVLLSSNENDLILDPFMGSGTTGVASRRYNRRFIGMEMNEEFYNIAKDRIEQEDYQLRLF